MSCAAHQLEIDKILAASELGRTILLNSVIE